jgi:hypothetical protein
VQDRKQTTASATGLTLVTGIGRVAVTRRQVETWSRRKEQRVDAKDPAA